MSKDGSSRTLTKRKTIREERYCDVVTAIYSGKEDACDLTVQYGYSNLKKAKCPSTIPNKGYFARLLAIMSTDEALEFMRKKIIQDIAEAGHVRLLKQLSLIEFRAWDNIMHHATIYQQDRIIRYILKFIDRDTYKQYVSSWMSNLASRGCFSMVKLIHNIWPDANLDNALESAVSGGLFRHVVYLVELGANVNYRDLSDNHLLLNAIESDSVKVVKYLISKEPIFTDDEQKDLMSAAVKVGNIKIIQYLMSNGFPLGDFVLDQTLENYSIELFKFLAENGVDLNRLRIRRMLLPINQSYGTLEYLLNHAHFEKDDLTEMLSYNILVREPSIDVVRLLMSFGAELLNTIQLRITITNIALMEFLLDVAPYLAYNLRQHDFREAIICGSVKIVKHMLNTGSIFDSGGLETLSSTKPEIVDMIMFKRFG
jgi:hypothetical protein